MAAFMAHTVCGSRSYAQVATGSFLPGGLAAIAAATGCNLHLLAASEGSQEGEGQLEVVCEQPVFAAVRAVAAILPPLRGHAAATLGQQVRPYCIRGPLKGTKYT
jgi:hypothetical protein